MLEKLQHICNILKNKNEIAIMKEYGSHSKRLSLIITCKTFIDISYMIQRILNFIKVIKFIEHKKKLVKKIIQYIFHSNFCNKDDVLYNY